MDNLAHSPVLSRTMIGRADVGDAHEPVRQEAAHAQAKKKLKAIPFTKHVLVADAREAGEPQLFYVSLQDAPKHMQEQLKQNEKSTYEFLIKDGPDSLMGLVDEEAEEAEDRAEEIWDYLDSKCVAENKYKPRIHRSIEFSFTLAAC